MSNSNIDKLLRRSSYCVSQVYEDSDGNSPLSRRANKLAKRARRMAHVRHRRTYDEQRGG